MAYIRVVFGMASRVHRALFLHGVVRIRCLTEMLPLMIDIMCRLWKLVRNLRLINGSAAMPKQS